MLCTGCRDEIEVYGVSSYLDCGLLSTDGANCPVALEAERIAATYGTRVRWWEGGFQLASTQPAAGVQYLRHQGLVQ